MSRGDGMKLGTCTCWAASCCCFPVMRCMSFPGGRSNFYPHTMRLYNSVRGTSPIFTLRTPQPEINWTVPSVSFVSCSHTTGMHSALQDGLGPASTLFLFQIRELVPESQAYMDLLAFERKLDQTIMRKRVDIQEALKRPMKVP